MREPSNFYVGLRPPLPEDNNLGLFDRTCERAHTVNFVLSEMDFDKESNETVRVVHDQDAATCGDWTYFVREQRQTQELNKGRAKLGC